MKKILLLSLLSICNLMLHAQTVDTPSGHGTSDDPYQIATLNNLYWLSQTSSAWGAYFIQTANIDASTTSTWDSGSGFSPIGNGTTKFTGRYNGKGHIISGLTINRSSTGNIGLFGCTSGATICNLGLTNAAITGSGTTGTIIGSASSTNLSNSYCEEGTVSNSSDYTGGLVGWLNGNSASISGCHFSGSVSGTRFVGGIAGQNTSDNRSAYITNCYCTGSVTGSGEYIGGIAGDVLRGTVSYCYNTGAVSGGSTYGGISGRILLATVTKCIWNTETTGQSSGCGYVNNEYSGTSFSGSGKTTTEMQTESTFTNTGWDFTGETANGSNNYWAIDATQNSGYPILVFIPTLTTTAISTFDATSATMGGSITFDGTVTYNGGTTVSARGIVYSSTDATPTIGETGVTTDDNGTGTGSFSKSISGLNGGTTYYARAYATNSVGTGYGDVLSFTTPPVTWTGTAWSPSAPTASDNVVIDGDFSDAGFSCNNLTANAGKQLTISSGTLTVAGNLTLKSDATGTASMIYNDGAVSVTGNTTVERYMAADAWHLITPPVSGQTIGTFLTANTTIKSNPDNSSQKALKDYNESANTWNGLIYTTGTTDLLSLGKGYAVWPSSAGVVSFTGTLPTGNQTVTVARTGDYGWNCMGNPYASSIAINANTTAGTSSFINANSGNMDASFGAIYVWDQTQSKYLTFNQSDAAYYLPVGQGFFVKAKTGATQISFTSAMQRHQPGAAFRSATAEKPEIDIDATMNGKQSTAKVRFIEKATKGLDFGYDAGAFKTGFDVYTKLVEDNGVDFAIQSLPTDPGNGYVIPVGLETSESGTVELSLTPINLPEGCTLTFEDTRAGTSTVIDESTKTLTAEVTSGITRNRFYLNVNKRSTDIEGTSSNLTVTSSDGEIIIHGAVKNDATATLYDLQGRRLTTVLLSGSINRIRTDNFTDGIYLLQLKQQGNIRNLKVVVKK